ncbi:putative exopolygalacturonase C [Hypsizygus marmoreus]|uniref:galacturonan 1,4-alpha-galacturonidase n=1 Tax=Hypsizygus marmoreus TaxID=39966 RepID=A0A369JQ91_HYPMA|nr:putative exopolygalacturonase C [Hypsizygus marmoreus]
MASLPEAQTCFSKTTTSRTATTASRSGTVPRTSTSGKIRLTKFILQPQADIPRNSYCEGGHGLSIGSLGKNGQVSDVQNVLIENVIMRNTLYGARFKSWTGGNGLARNITWKNIAFSNVPFPIYITQNYWDQGVGPRPNMTSTNNTHIQDFRFENFAGTIDDSPDFFEGTCISDPCWYFVPGATGKEIAILDLYPGTASNIVAKDIVAKTKTGSPVAVMCDPETIPTDVGFKCWKGKFIRTKAGI